MIFLVSNDGIEWSLDFGPDSVTVTVKNIVHERKISSQEILLAAWSLLLSQRQQFLNNHLARVAITPNQQGTNEMRDEVLSSVGIHVVSTRGYQVFADLNDVEFYWENGQLDVDAVFIPDIDKLFRQQRSTTWRWEVVQQKTPFCLTRKKNKEKSPPTTPVSERPTGPPALLISRPFGTRLEEVPDCAYRNLFQKYYRVCVFKYVITKVLHFIITFSKKLSDMCVTKTVVVSKSKNLPVAVIFCIYQAYKENEVGHHSKIKSQGPCEKEYKKYCLNGFKCYYVVDEDFVDCNCTWL